MARAASSLAAYRSPVRSALRPSRTVRLTLLLSSGLINILTLTGSLFMMQVYDRVLGSQSIETLVALSLIALFAYVMQGVLDGYRGRILTLLAERFDAEIAPRVNAANLVLALRTSNGAAEQQRNTRCRGSPRLHRRPRSQCRVRPDLVAYLFDGGLHPALESGCHHRGGVAVFRLADVHG